MAASRVGEHINGEANYPHLHNLALSLSPGASSSGSILETGRDAQPSSPIAFFSLRFWLSARYYSTGEEVFISHRLHLRLLSVLWRDTAHIIVQCVPPYLSHYQSQMGRAALSCYNQVEVVALGWLVYIHISVCIYQYTCACLRIHIYLCVCVHTHNVCSCPLLQTHCPLEHP